MVNTGGTFGLTVMTLHAYYNLAMYPGLENGTIPLIYTFWLAPHCSGTLMIIYHCSLLAKEVYIFSAHCTLFMRFTSNIICSFVGKTNIPNRSWDYKLLQRSRIAAVGRNVPKVLMRMRSVLDCWFVLSSFFNIVALFVTANRASPPDCVMWTVHIQLDSNIRCMTKMSKHWLSVWI